MTKIIYKHFLYLYVDELRDYCKKLSLQHTGTKIDLIERIMCYVSYGKVLKVNQLPAQSMGNSKIQQEITLDTLMLKNVYKNDMKNRIFFKQIIGNHFHFTAHAIKWLKMRWHQGNPPTYREFIQIWQKIYDNTYKPLNEWAYIIFIQNNKNLTKNELLTEWHKARSFHKQKVENIINNYLIRYAIK